MIALQQEGMQARTAQCYWLGIQPYQSSFDPVIPRIWCHSPSFHGFEACGFLLFSANLPAEKPAPKALVFSDFSLLCLHHCSPSIIRHSTTNTSLSHPRCRHWPCGHGLFSFFVGMLSRYAKAFLPDRA